MFEKFEEENDSVTFISELRTLYESYGTIISKRCEMKPWKVKYLYDSLVDGSNAIDAFQSLDDKKFKEMVQKYETQKIKNKKPKIKIVKEPEPFTEYEAALMKNEMLIDDLCDIREDFCGLNSNKVKRRLNKIKETDMVAKALRIALESEDKNICAKKYYGEYKDKIYNQKYDLIIELTQLFEIENWVYGIQKVSNFSADYVIYFEIPGCEQLSWHINVRKNDNFPKYDKPWDRKENSTLWKLEKAIKNKLNEYDLL